MQELVVKSNELIEGHYHLSAVSQKVSAAVISLVNPLDIENPLPEFVFTIREFSALLGVSERRVRQVIDNVTLELKQVVITLRKRNSESYRRVGLFNYCDYNDEEKTVGFKFEPALDAYIRDFASNFTQYQLAQIKELKSKYAIRLYEILRKAHPVSVKREYSFYQVEIEELKRMVGLKPTAYKGRYDRFKAAVIEVSKRELAQKTDLVFDVKLIRKGRSAHALKFIISHNQQFEEVKDEALDGDLAALMDISSISPHVILSIKSQIPDITNTELALIGHTYPQELILEGLFDLIRAMASGSVNGTPLNYYMGILKNKRREDKAAEPKPQKTTDEKLTDRSWAKGLEFGED